MKSVISIIFALFLLLCIGFGTADSDNPLSFLHVRMTLSQDTFSEPGSTKATIFITNTADTQCPAPIHLLDQAGQPLADYDPRTLAAGESLTWSGTIEVTQDVLDAGRISFFIQMDVPEEGMIHKRGIRFNKAIRYWVPNTPDLLLPNLGAGEWSTPYTVSEIEVIIESNSLEINEFGQNVEESSDRLYTVTLVGKEPGTAYIILELRREGTVIMYMDIEITVDEQLNVIISHVEVVEGKYYPEYEDNKNEEEW